MRRTTYVLAVLVVLPAALPSPAAEYVVKHGDTLSQIAQSQLGSSTRWREIATLNGLKPPYVIRVGQRLVLPGSGSRQPTATPPPGEQPPQSGAPLDLPSNLWACVPVALVGLWLFTAVCLRIGCWFSLVETSFARCAFLSILSAGCVLLALGILAGISYLVVCRHIPRLAFPISGGVLVLAYIVAFVLLTKRILRCKWRSVVTVGIMGATVADVVAFGLLVVLLASLPGIMATRLVQEFITAIIDAQ